MSPAGPTSATFMSGSSRMLTLLSCASPPGRDPAVVTDRVLPVRGRQPVPKFPLLFRRRYQGRPSHRVTPERRAVEDLQKFRLRQRRHAPAGRRSRNLATELFRPPRPTRRRPAESGVDFRANLVNDGDLRSGARRMERRQCDDGVTHVTRQVRPRGRTPRPTQGRHPEGRRGPKRPQCGDLPAGRAAPQAGRRRFESGHPLCEISTFSTSCRNQSGLVARRVTLNTDDPDLAALIEAWPTLPTNVKAAVRLLVEHHFNSEG